MIKETSAGIVLFRKEGIKKIISVLLHYPSGHWDFIKGKMEKGETTLRNSNQRNKRRNRYYRYYIYKKF